MKFKSMIAVTAVIGLLFIRSESTAHANDSAIEPAIVFEVGDIEWPLAQSLDYVLSRVQNDIRFCVLDIDSKGGYVSEARAIVQVIEKYPEIRFVAYIRSAISAAIWPAMAVPEVYMEPGATVGGAQMFYIDTTGNVLVDGKMNSIQEAYVRALAQKNGHPEDFVKSMIIPTPTGNKRHMRYSRWSRQNGYEYVSTYLKEARVSTYTAMEAESAGFGKIVRHFDEVAPKTAKFDRATANAISYSRALARKISTHWFAEVYVPETVAVRVPRGEIQVTKKSTYGRGFVRNTNTYKTTRRQTDHEHEKSQDKVENKVRRILANSQKLAEDIEKYLQKGYGAILVEEDIAEKRKNKMLIQRLIKPKVTYLQKSVLDIQAYLDRDHATEIVAQLNCVAEAINEVD